MLNEVTQGGFFAYENETEITEYFTPLVSDQEPWGVYSILGVDVDYEAVFAAASEYKAVQNVAVSAANTAAKVPVSANSHREREQHVFHIEFEYGSADQRAFIQAVVRSLKSLQDKTAFDVLLPTGRTVTVTFTSIDDTWPFEFGQVVMIVQALEYSPFPIFSQIQTVNKQYNGFFSNQGRIAGAPQATTITPQVVTE